MVLVGECPPIGVHGMGLLSPDLFGRASRYTYLCRSTRYFVATNDACILCVVPRYQQEMETYKAKKAAEAPEEEEGSDEESD